MNQTEAREYAHFLAKKLQGGTIEDIGLCADAVDAGPEGTIWVVNVQWLQVEGAQPLPCAVPEFIKEPVERPKRPKVRGTARL